MTNDQLTHSFTNRFKAIIRHLSFVICHLLLFVNAIQAVEPDSVRDGYRHFIMPTGKPIEGGYLGFWELALMQAGYGFGDVVSVSAGFTILPTVPFRFQIGNVQTKLTLFDDQGLSLSTGLNFL